MPEGSVVVGHTPRSVAEILEQDAGERRGYPVKKVEIDVHRCIAHLTHKMRFKIVLPSRRSQRQRLGLSASHGTDIVRQRRAKLPQWLDDPLPLFDWAVVAEENSAYFVPTIWEGRQEGDDIHLVGHIGGELADQGEQFLCFVVRVDQVTRQHRWADGMQLVLERGNDAEITPTAPKAPQQVGVLVGVGGEHTAIGGDHVGRDQVVATEAVVTGQPSDAASQRKTGDAGVRVGTSRRGAAEGWVSWSKAPHLVPPWARTVLAAGLTRTPVIRERSIINPSSQTLFPGKLWPPPRTEISKSFSLAKLTDLITSAVPLHRETRAGRLSTMAFQIRLTLSYPSSPSSKDTPCRLPRKSFTVASVMAA